MAGRVLRDSKGRFNGSTRGFGRGRAVNAGRAVRARFDRLSPTKKGVLIGAAAGGVGVLGVGAVPGAIIGGIVGRNVGIRLAARPPQRKIKR